MRIILSQKFFERPTPTVAKELLWKFLIRKIGKKEIALPINEVEVYDGFEDKASHARSGQTPRNAPMYGHPGHWYVYLTYGMHFMLNIATRESGYPAAILIRGVEGVSGPGRLTKFFKIDKKLNTLPAKKTSGLWIEDRGVKILSKEIKKTPRVGIDHSGPVWSKKPWRFVIEKRKHPKS